MERTYCIYDDAPDSVHAIQLGNKVTRVSLVNDTEYFTSGVTVSRNAPSQLALVMFRYTNAKAAGTMNLFGSLSSGAPSSVHYDQKDSGVTLTIPFAYDDWTQREFFPWYFALQSSLLNEEIETGIGYQRWDVFEIEADREHEYTIDREHGFDFFTHMYFTIPNIKANERLNITTITYNDTCDQSILYSEQRQDNPYPDEFTRDTVADTGPTSETFTHLNYISKPRTKDGNAYVVVVPFCTPYSTTPKLRITVARMKE